MERSLRAGSKQISIGHHCQNHRLKRLLPHRFMTWQFQVLRLRLQVPMKLTRIARGRIQAGLGIKSKRWSSSPERSVAETKEVSRPPCNRNIFVSSGLDTWRDQHHYSTTGIFMKLSFDHNSQSFSLDLTPSGSGKSY